MHHHQPELNSLLNYADSVTYEYIYIYILIPVVSANAINLLYIKLMRGRTIRIIYSQYTFHGYWVNNNEVQQRMHLAVAPCAVNALCGCFASTENVCIIYVLILLPMIIYMPGVPDV